MRDKDVTFIRKNGRLIPIKRKTSSVAKARTRKLTKNERKSKAKSSIFKAASSGILASISGSIFGTFTGEANRRKSTLGALSNQTANAVKRGDQKAANKFSKVLERRRKNIKGLGSFGRNVGRGGFLVSTVLGGKAFTEAFEASTGKDLTQNQEIFTEAAGASVFAISANRVAKSRGKNFKRGARLLRKLVVKR